MGDSLRGGQHPLVGVSAHNCGTSTSEMDSHRHHAETDADSGEDLDLDLVLDLERDRDGVTVLNNHVHAAVRMLHPAAWTVVPMAMASDTWLVAAKGPQHLEAFLEAKDAGWMEEKEEEKIRGRPKGILPHLSAAGIDVNHVHQSHERDREHVDEEVDREFLSHLDETELWEEVMHRNVTRGGLVPVPVAYPEGTGVCFVVRASLHLSRGDRDDHHPHDHRQRHETPLRVDVVVIRDLKDPEWYLHVPVRPSSASHAGRRIRTAAGGR